MKDHQAQAQALEAAAEDLPLDITVLKKGQRETLETVRQWLLQRASDLRKGPSQERGE